MAKKIGIMGGTFNPIHFGHLLLAEQAMEAYDLDEVLFIPSGNPYMKDTEPIVNGDIRAKMIELAIDGHPYFRLSSMELERKGPTYTFETLEELKKKNSECTYFFITGADSLLTMETWKNPERIFKNCVVIASVRGTGTEEKIRKIATHLIYEYQADVHILPTRFIDLSSSEIRYRIAEGKSVRYMLPEKVREYIYENDLYQNE
ncbi:MAG: nicotinate-nucleotide adenylyltransferase [Lachnospiraceae bacterium]|nr:nicotinate-nucleotide adenylyltransferase [Lachnospiraceae bacterium]